MRNHEKARSYRAFTFHPPPPTEWDNGTANTEADHAARELLRSLKLSDRHWPLSGARRDIVDE